MKNPTFARLLVVFLACIFAHPASAREKPAGTRIVRELPYYPADLPVEDPDKRCLLDLQVPEDDPGFATLVWFHGGGLTGGKLGFPQIAGKDIALVGAGYRLSPQVDCPVFLEDAAAAVAWTVKNIASFGGDPKKVFVGGHSAIGPSSFTKTKTSITAALRRPRRKSCPPSSRGFPKPCRNHLEEGACSLPLRRSA